METPATGWDRGQLGRLKSAGCPHTCIVYIFLPEDRKAVVGCWNFWASADGCGLCTPEINLLWRPFPITAVPWPVHYRHPFIHPENGREERAYVNLYNGKSFFFKIRNGAIKIAPWAVKRLKSHFPKEGIKMVNGEIIIVTDYQEHANVYKEMPLNICENQISGSREIVRRGKRCC